MPVITQYINSGNLKTTLRVTPALRELHWLPVAERIQYKLCLLVHKSLLGHTPEYISNPLTSVANIPGRSTLLHCALHRVATSSCRWHVDELATEPFLLLYREHGTGYRWSWNSCDWRTCFVVIWKHFCFILFMGTKIWIDSVMRPRSSSRGRITGTSVTVIVILHWRPESLILMSCQLKISRK